MKNNLPPSRIFPALFETLHASGLWPDGKMLSDAVPLATPDEIVSAFQEEKQQVDFDLKAFFERYFQPNPSRSVDFESDLTLSIEAHIERLWPVLTRAKDPHIEGSSLLPLPYEYIVPGGRFNEIYYWDSYFTQLGLVQSGRVSMVASMVANFAFLIDEVGFIPNGNRSYFLGRSQPPFFSLMVRLLANQKGPQMLHQYRMQLEKEYTFWMRGHKDLSLEGEAQHRVVLGPNAMIWNRYHDAFQSPRDEMYQTDLELAQKSKQSPEVLYRHLRAACESGWDFSSRWFADPQDIDTIYTSDIIPVDLNCLLYHLEQTLAEAFSGIDTQKEAFYQQKAHQRKKAIQANFWNAETQFFHDLNRLQMAPTPALTLAGLFPLFFELATEAQAAACARRVETQFLKKGGLITTLHQTGQQWDAPNGWAPLQWIAVQGLRLYGYRDLANEISDRWVALNKKVYQNSGKMLEKYNVENPDLRTGGGEYPVQDGFGWSNGVLLQLLATR